MVSGAEAAASDPTFETVKIEFDGGIAWVALNRPHKRNAMNPTLNREMSAVLDWLELEDRCKILVLTGAEDSFTAGMDLKEYFRESEGKSALEIARIRRQAGEWQWRKLRFFAKPTIAMVNGWCFGGAFTPLIACDLAVAADEATFGLSEINWGIIPAGNVTRAIADVMDARAAIYYVMTGETFNGQRAKETGLVNESVPLVQLRGRVRELALTLMKKNPVVLRHAKNAFKRARPMDWDTSEDFLAGKAAMVEMQDLERGDKQGMKQFLDEKSFRPGLAPYRREE